MLTRRQVLRSAAVTAIAAPLITKYSGANAQAQVTLRVHHFLPPPSNPHRTFLVPWGEKVQQESQNRIRVQVFPSMQLGGRPADLFDQARDGTVDIVWTLPANTPGRFPVTETFELPFMAASAEANSQAFHTFMTRHGMAEFREVHPIVFFAHDPGLIHTRERPVRTRADLQGQRIRFPTRLFGETLRVLGANPIGMPIPEVPQALQQGVLDGAVMPWEVVPSVRVHELCRHHTAMAGTRGLYTATFVVAMNKAKYEGLPADLRAVIDANSGQALARHAGQLWDTNARPGLEAARARNNNFYEIAPAELQQWQQATQPVIDTWVQQMNQRNVDAQRLIAEARALIAQHAGA